MQSIAVFFDRDGTLIEEVNYLDSLAKVKILPGVVDGIRQLNEKLIKVIVISNQSGVARGYFSEDFVRETHKFIAAELAKQGAIIDAFYFCPHHPSAGQGEFRRNCDCRKPATGMVTKAIREWNIDVTRSFVVGDSASDMQVARAVGAQEILVSTGHGKNFQDMGFYTVAGVAEAVAFVVSEGEKT
ncbi:MAG: HAD family hydrolase [Deltaproteobacteria bacterium]|nr:HAD family hydrolase [Deltaproteobacteria bacterium]